MSRRNRQEKNSSAEFQESNFETFIAIILVLAILAGQVVPGLWLADRWIEIAQNETEIARIILPLTNVLFGIVLTYLKYKGREEKFESSLSKTFLYFKNAFIVSLWVYGITAFAEAIGFLLLKLKETFDQWRTGACIVSLFFILIAAGYCGKKTRKN